MGTGADHELPPLKCLPPHPYPSIPGTGLRVGLTLSVEGALSGPPFGQTLYGRWFQGDLDEPLYLTISLDTAGLLIFLAFCERQQYSTVQSGSKHDEANLHLPSPDCDNE